MAGRSKYEDGTKQYTVRLTERIAEYFKTQGESLAAGINAVGEECLSGVDSPCVLPETKAAMWDSPFPPESRGRSHTLPPIYGGGVDVTPRFKAGVESVVVCEGVRSRDFSLDTPW